MSRRLYPLLALILALALIGAGCGGGDEGDDDATPAAAEAEAEGAGAGGSDADQDDDAEAGGGDSESDDSEPSDDAAGPEQVVRDYIKAVAAGDDSACKLLSEAARTAIAESLSELETGEEDRPATCEDLFAFIAEFGEDDGFEIGGEEVPADELDSLKLEAKISDDGQTAKVTAEGEPESVELKRIDGRWKISSLPTGAG